MRADGNLVDERIEVGTTVQLNANLPGQYRMNTTDRFDLTAGTRFVVTRVYTENLQVRTVETLTVTETRNYNRQQVQRNVSFSIPRTYLMVEDPNYVPPPPPRKLGQRPDPEDWPEGVELIDVDHPGIQWLFDDLGAYADGKGWCSEYDRLCRDVGIPGRPQDYNVTRTLNGIQIRATIKARSQQEANDMFAKAMSAPAEV
jgi:hypothetical protein